jgi:PleD family two-component response regulator
MGKARLMIVEDDLDIANMLSLFFKSQGYEVDWASHGRLALEKIRQVMPHLILLDIVLPDIDGYEVCHSLRTNLRTSHIPVIFLTQRDERADKLKGLELGADDYITKPFDIDELRLRVQNVLSRAERESLTDPQSGLPCGRLIEEQLRKVIQQSGWALLDVRIDHFGQFKDVYGFIAANGVIRFTSMLLGEVVDELGAADDFIGHAGGDNFVIITRRATAGLIKKRLKERFSREVRQHYSFTDRQRGYMIIPTRVGENVLAPFMSLSIGIVSPETHQFSDIREITEIAAAERRKTG